jgi:mono/diheme cytochrome c family protein
MKIKMKVTLTSGGAIALLAFMVLVLSVHPAAAQQGAGASLYKAKCSACHGSDGKGDTSIGKMEKIRDLTSEEVQKQDDADWTAIINTGKNKMPAYGKSLKPEQVKDLVGYIRTLAKK